MSNHPFTQRSIHRTLICSFDLSIYWEHRISSDCRYWSVSCKASIGLTCCDFIKTGTQVICPNHTLLSFIPSLGYINKNVLYSPNWNSNSLDMPIKRLQLHMEEDFDMVSPVSPLQGLLQFQLGPSVQDHPKETITKTAYPSHLPQCWSWLGNQKGRVCKLLSLKLLRTDFC